MDAYILRRCNQQHKPRSYRQSRLRQSNVDKGGMMVVDWAVMCNEGFVPIAALLTMLWTGYQEYRHQTTKEEIKTKKS